jgi:hypothetical protein
VLSEPWNLEINAHAAERFFQRQPPGADLWTALRTGNAVVSRGRAYLLEDADQVLVPSGRGGCFRGEIVLGELHEHAVRGWSWISRDQADGAATPLALRGLCGTSGQYGNSPIAGMADL